MEPSPEVPARICRVCDTPVQKLPDPPGAKQPAAKEAPATKKTGDDHQLQHRVTSTIGVSAEAGNGIVDCQAVEVT